MTSGAVKVSLPKPIKAARIVQDSTEQSANTSSDETHTNANTSAEHIRTMHELETKKAQLCQLLSALQEAINKLDQFYMTALSAHKEQIAKLSLEIARKVLIRKVEEGDYKIESIIEEALKNAPTRQDVVIHLNPEDFAKCQEYQQNNPAGALSDIKFVSDPSIKPAGCLLKTPKGVIESSIEGHLEQIEKALKAVE